MAMRRFELSDEQGVRVKGLLPGKKGDPGRTAADSRLFLDAVLWIARTGAPWRDLPERFGLWIRSSSGSLAGPRRACGSGSLKRYKTLTWSG